MRRKKNKIKSYKQLPVLICIVVFALIGTYLITKPSAFSGWFQGCTSGVGCPPYTANPPITPCVAMDIIMLVDTSTSMAESNWTPLRNATNAMKAFATAMEGTGTEFAAGYIDGYEVYPFSQDPATVHKNIDNISRRGGNSRLTYVANLNNSAPRPDRQNLIILLTDFEITVESLEEVNEVKKNGTRILALYYRPDSGTNQNNSRMNAAKYLAGPNVDTGSVVTSDVITLNSNTIGAEFASFAQQLCGSGRGGYGNGNGGIGNGTGIGGTGAGTNGVGQGSGPGSGAGAAGGGGSLATEQAEQPNPLPSNSAQGTQKENPKVEPSAFFDGKEFEPGSDPDDQVFGSSNVAGRQVPKLVLYAVSLLLLGGAGGALWWRHKQKSKV